MNKVFNQVGGLETISTTCTPLFSWNEARRLQLVHRQAPGLLLCSWPVWPEHTSSDIMGNTARAFTNLQFRFQGNFFIRSIAYPTNHVHKTRFVVLLWLILIDFTDILPDYFTSTRAIKPLSRAEKPSGPRLNIKTVLSTYGDFHVKDKTAVKTSYL